MPDLPAEPSLEQLRHQARDLQRAVRQGNQDALAEVAARHPGHPPAAGYPLSAAQLVIARRYGFPSWNRLRRYAEVVERYSRFPERMTAGGPADEFLRLGCLSYQDDHPERWAQARQVLAAHPGITQLSVHAAAAAADVPRLRAHLAGDRAAARRPGGPFRCEPLFYLAYTRHDPAIGLDAVLTSARLLLESGADPNDGQALYNRMFEPGNDHLELLLEFGLGTGDGGPGKARLGDALGTPERLLRGELSWAIVHGMTERVRLLADHGVDLAAPLPDGTTPAQCAAATGHPDLVRFLTERGAAAPAPDPEQRFVAAALAADQAGLEARTCPPSSRGRPRCTSRRWKAAWTWPGACSGWAPTPACATSASVPPRSAGPATSARSSSSSCSSR